MPLKTNFCTGKTLKNWKHKREEFISFKEKNEYLDERFNWRTQRLDLVISEIMLKYICRNKSKKMMQDLNLFSLKEFYNSIPGNLLRF